MPKKTFKKNFSKINNHIFCYDLETGDKDPYTCDPLECYGVIIDINTLQIKEDGKFGPVLIKPLNNDWSRVKEDALEKNKLNIEEIKEKGLDQKVFFEQLVAFLNKFERSNKRYDTVISAGFNVINFDDIIVRQLCNRYKSEYIFHYFHNFDLASILRPWFYDTNTLETFELKNIRAYFGITNIGAHTAKFDTESTAKILCRFLKFYKQLAPRYLEKFHNCFSEENNG